MDIDDYNVIKVLIYCSRVGTLVCKILVLSDWTLFALEKVVPSQ